MWDQYRSAWESLFWWQSFLVGVATNSQAAMLRGENWWLRKPTSRIRTPLLTLSVSNLRLNPHERLNAQNAKQFLKGVE
jgi:hypothetical protein